MGKLGQVATAWIATSKIAHETLTMTRGLLSSSSANLLGCVLPLAQQVPREQHQCIFCASGSAEDEHHFVFDCPAYCAIRNKFTNIFWSPAPTLSSLFTLHDPKVVARGNGLNTGTHWLQHKLDIAFRFSLDCVRCEHYVVISA